MNNQTIYWLWIQRAVGCGSAAITTITERFTFAEDFYRAPLDDKIHSLSRYYSLPERLKDPDLSVCKGVIDRCRTLGIEIVSYGDEAYPELLRQIDSPPAVLFVKGNIDALRHELCIGIVGTRNATKAGRKTAFTLAHGLAKENVCVVSGGAVGIDIEAHMGALRAHGKTICVLGCGHAYPYLPEHDPVKREIVKQGAVISEFAPDMPPSRGTFPMRNRIISGLSKGIVVVEAGRRSGSLITANQALKQNRDVFAVPGGLDNPYSIGTNDLIKDGAVTVTNTEDILKEYRGIRDIPSQVGLFESAVESAAARTASKPVQKSDKYAKNRRTFREADESSILNYNEDASFGDYLMVMSAFSQNSFQRDTSEKAAPSSKARVKKQAAQVKETRREPPKQERAEERREPSASAVSDDIMKELSENAALVLRALSASGTHIDVIAEKTGLSINAVHSAATELEMYGLTEALEGRRYKPVN